MTTTDQGGRQAGSPGSQVDRSGLDEGARRALEAGLRAAVRGDVRFDAATRAVYAADSSNYRQVPLGVVFPLDTADVVAAVAVCRAHGAPILGRGAGTSLAGQGCNVAVVVDFSRHMNRVLEIDPVARTARVQPGIVLDDLQAAIARVGQLAFGPDPATHAWCTLGGMIGNNSCGTHALYAGKTVDNVESLRVVTYGGLELEVGPGGAITPAAAGPTGGAGVGRGEPRAEAQAEPQAQVERIRDGLRSLADRYGPLVRERFPDVPRRVSGYNLDQLLPENNMHVARALVGTESTCVLVTEATIRLSERPVERRLVVLGFPDVFQAADAVPGLLELGRSLAGSRGLEHALLGLEGFDDTLTRQMRKANLNTEALDLLPAGRGWLLAELGAHDAPGADELAGAFVAGLSTGIAWRRFDDAPGQRRVWSVRESGLGATARPPGEPANHEGWEDAAVAPERLGAYLRAITELWDEFGYSGAWYGHFGQGCVHTRNNFDLGTLEGLARYRAYLERAAEVCVSFGGSLSGEHGDGQGRGELLATMFGDELVGAFGEFKALFDPTGRMNPGKVVDPFPLDTNLKHGPDRRHSSLGPLYYAFADDAGSLEEAMERCVGVGRCRRDDVDVMCPSYRVTRDERHSTRGRARLFVEMMQGEVVATTWQSEEVREALELCLGCKGCALDCPTHVDMATYKSEFLAHYYAARRRPAADRALGALPRLARLASYLPRTANVLAGDNVLGRAAKRATGITATRPAPLFAGTAFRRSPVARRRAADAASLDAAGGAPVVVWPDTFTNAFRPGILHDTVAVLEAGGERVVVPRQWACCGRTLYDSGMLDQARATLRRLLDVLTPYVDAGCDVVVPEPSCLAAFRDELPKLLADDPRAARLAGAARSLAEHLLGSSALEALVRAAPPLPDGTGTVLVQPHCHGRAIGTPAADRQVLARLGYDARLLDAGCCGLAGAFGYKAEHDEVSREIAQQWWIPRLAAQAGSAPVVLDGFSCSIQLEHLDPARHATSTTLAALCAARLAPGRTADRAAAGGPSR